MFKTKLGMFGFLAFLKKPHYLTDMSPGEIRNNVLRSLQKAFPLSFPVLHLLPQRQAFW